MTALRGTLTSPEFLAGLGAGIVAAVIGAASSWVWRSKTARPAPLIGLLATVAAIWAFPIVRPVPAELLAGLGLLGVAGLVANVFSTSLALNVVMAVPGAWLLMSSIPGVGRPWAAWLLFSAVIIGGPLTAMTDSRLSGPALGPLLLAISLAGIYLDVPDTEEMLVLAGVIAPLVLLGWPIRLSIIGSPGSYMAVGLLAWAAAWGGIGRPASIVGAVGCLGVFLVFPFAARGQEIASSKAWVLLVVVHTAAVGVSSRAAGLRTDPRLAALIVVGALLSGLLAVRRVSMKIHEPTSAPGVAPVWFP